MSYTPIPYMVGYWGTADEGSDFPHPSELMVPGGLGDLKENVVRYLASGREYLGWLGYSHCRFHCGVEDRDMGDRDLSDGLWVWPQGLAHYVACHDISLPGEFLDTMRASQWSVPKDRPLHIPTSDCSMLGNFWADWTKQLRAKAKIERSDA
jgi:hypothetical protein